MKFIAFSLLVALLFSASDIDKLYFTHPTENDIEALIANMTIEEKVGQTCQITLDAIHKTDQKGQALIPEQIDEAKLKEALEVYHVGSVLNVGWHTLKLEEWKSVMSDIHAPYLKHEQNIPLLYGIDAIHGVNYTVGGTLFPHINSCCTLGGSIGTSFWLRKTKSAYFFTFGKWHQVFLFLLFSSKSL